MTYPIGTIPTTTGLAMPEPIGARAAPGQPGNPAQQVTQVGGPEPGRWGNDVPQSQDQSALPLDKALDQINDSLRAWSTGIRFDMDDEAQRLVVSIVDSSTGKVLRTIPSDAVLRVARMIARLQGSGVNTQA